MHNFHEIDEHLKKAFKLSYATLHSGNNKQSVSLALNAAIIIYFPNETAAAGFLMLINILWTIANSKYKVNTNNRMGNAAVPNDRKAQFSERLQHG